MRGQSLAEKQQSQSLFKSVIPSVPLSDLDLGQQIWHTSKPPYFYTFIWCLRLRHVVFPLAVISHQTFTLDSHWATHKISHTLWFLTEWLLLFHLFCLHPHSSLCTLQIRFIDFPITKLPPLSNNTQLRAYLGQFLTLFINYSTSACSFWDAPWFTWLAFSRTATGNKLNLFNYTCVPGRFWLKGTQWKTG